jgi:hypothetical protein
MENNHGLQPREILFRDLNKKLQIENEFLKNSIIEMYANYPFNDNAPADIILTEIKTRIENKNIKPSELENSLKNLQELVRVEKASLNYIKQSLGKENKKYRSILIVFSSIFLLLTILTICEFYSKITNQDTNNTLQKYIQLYKENNFAFYTYLAYRISIIGFATLIIYVMIDFFRNLVLEIINVQRNINIINSTLHLIENVKLYTGVYFEEDALLKNEIEILKKKNEIIKEAMIMMNDSPMPFLKKFVKQKVNK